VPQHNPRSRRYRCRRIGASYRGLQLGPLIGCQFHLRIQH
jgi:hypothetical protein